MFFMVFALLGPPSDCSLVHGAPSGKEASWPSRASLELRVRRGDLWPAVLCDLGINLMS